MPFVLLIQSQHAQWQNGGPCSLSNTKPHFWHPTACLLRLLNRNPSEIWQSEIVIFLQLNFISHPALITIWAPAIFQRANKSASTFNNATQKIRNVSSPKYLLSLSFTYAHYLSQHRSTMQTHRISSHTSSNSATICTISRFTSSAFHRHLRFPHLAALLPRLLHSLTSDICPLWFHSAMCAVKTWLVITLSKLKYFWGLSAVISRMISREQMRSMELQFVTPWFPTSTTTWGR